MSLANEIGLPQHVLQSLPVDPGDNISITKFLAWSLPPCASINAHFTHVEIFLSPLPPNIERFDDILAIHSPPNSIINILAEKQDPSIKSIQCLT